MDCRTQLASMAIDEVDKGDFEMATKILTTSIRLEPNNYELYFERSICHHKLANYQASLDDANAAIRLNSSDYNIHYQRGLALIGLSLFSEAVASFKKAIELRAKQDDSKLSDIFKLLRDATNELNTARRRPGTTIVGQARTTDNNNSTSVGNGGVKLSTQTPATPKTLAATSFDQTTSSTTPVGRSPNSEFVDSTTDKPSPPAIASRLGPSATTTTTTTSKVLISPNQPTNHVGLQPSSATSVAAPVGTVFVNQNGTNSNLVATSKRNSNQKQCANQVLFVGAESLGGSAVATAASTPNRVSSSAAAQQYQFSDPKQHTNSFGSPSVPFNQRHPEPQLVKPEGNSKDNHHDHSHHRQQQQHDAMKGPPAVGSFEWNIRRSERIFLHNSSEPGTSGPNDETASQPRGRLNSNPSSVSSGKGANKRPYERHNNDTTTGSSGLKQPAYPTVKTNGTSSVLDSDIDVDDSSTIYSSVDTSGQTHKRVMVTPSSSMPATGQQGITATSTKEYSYASQYKRQRRDRERARRGTSKLCTIKPSDLDELQKMYHTSSERRFMRVIAPIDGWLYSGQLSLDDNNNQQDGGTVDSQPHYVVKLDGDPSGSSYLFTQETVLNDVIKEVRVKSVSELRKGARICCYWSRTYKCLSTGVVTSRTFEATKSLVSVKYDNGDLSALPLEDLRLLPPDYPKYMSNCDPLLLAKNGDNSDPSASPNKTSRIVVDSKSSSYKPCATYSKTAASDTGDSTVLVSDPSPDPQAQLTTDQTNGEQLDNSAALPTVESMRSALDDDTIPPTDETINFITGEADMDAQDDSLHIDVDGGDEHPKEGGRVNGNIVTTNDSAAAAFEASRASSEENNFGIEYRPWVFEGPSKRSKRNGRTYRDIYSAIRRGNEVIKVGDSAELMPRDESIPPFVAKIDSLWATARGEMRVRVRWYYRLSEAEGEPYELEDGENALFETDHFDENDIQSIWRTTKILSWTDYARDHLRHVNRPSDGPKVFYLAGHYDPVRCIKHLRSDVKTIQ